MSCYLHFHSCFSFFFIFIAVPAPTPPAPPPALPAALAPLAVARFNAFFFALPTSRTGFRSKGGRGTAPACCQVLSIIRCMHSLLSLPFHFVSSPYTAPFSARSVFLKRAKFSFINALNLPHSTEGAASRPREGMGGAGRQSYIM